MQVHPTRAAVDLAVAGMVTVGVGVASQQAAIVAWGGALLVGLAIARAVTELSIARIRAAGFEMLWRSELRTRRVARGETLELEAEVRNRDTRAARYVGLRSVCSPDLEVELEPLSGEVPAGGRLSVQVRVTARRVGWHGLHGLSLEVQGNPGLFEVPLTFANAFGIEVLPRPFGVAMRSARGGRSRMTAEAGRPGPLSGDGSDLRELREHQPGDPFKRIAWKASARRGVLLVRDYEREERDVVWLLCDASVELWAGPPGTAPLDLAIDEVAAVAQRHLSRGDRVGLGVIGARPLAWIAPERGPAHGIQIMSALAHAAATLDADRSDLDEVRVAERVIEHMRPLDPIQAHRVRVSDLDRVMRRAERVAKRAPFSPPAPVAPTERERTLRRYLAAFGIGSPPRLEPERSGTDRALAEALRRLLRERPQPSVVYLWSPAPEPGQRPEIERALAHFPRRSIALCWASMKHEPSLERAGSGLEAAVASAVAVRARVAEERGERALRHLGVHVEKWRPGAARARAGQ